MKKAVVTGGAGFIGSHLVDELVRREFITIVIDNVPPDKAVNIRRHIDNTAIDYVEGSILNFEVPQGKFAGADYIFHQAAITNIDALANPVAYYEANTKAILNVLQAALENKVGKVVFASSCAVYGNEPTVPKREDMLPSPESPYALTKLIGEQYCDLYTKVHGLPTVCLRYFNVYGPRQNPASSLASVIPKFIRSVREGKAPVIFGDGEQTRDFVFVKDVVNANLLAAESNATGIYNIGIGESVSLNELADMIIRLIGNNIQPIHKAAIGKEIRNSLAYIAKAKAFGFKPKYILKAGLSEILNSF
jgi:UDP-glucose 4-epimerase